VRDLPTGTVTFVFTDVECSTRHLKRLRERYRDLLTDHRRIVLRAVAEHGGREIDSQAESFFAAFPRAKDAVAATIDIQLCHGRHDWPGGEAVRVRIGVQTAEPDVFEERYIGLGVHRAARLSAVGHGGQVLLSRSTAGLIDEEELPGISVRDLGDHRLKDLERPERIYQLVAAGLDEEFPPLRSVSEVARATEVAARPSGTVTFLATDIVGSTALLRRFGREWAADFLDLYESVMRQHFAEAGGHEIELVGDSFLVVFHRPKDAIEAATAALRAIPSVEWPENEEPPVRMGIHTGEAARRRSRYVGLALIRALRICEAASAGQVLVSPATESLLEACDLGELSFRDVGEHRVKDFERPIHLFELLVDEAEMIGARRSRRLRRA
jgi:class 3 adenylate cyclase